MNINNNENVAHCYTLAKEHILLNDYEVRGLQNLNRMAFCIKI